MDNTRRMSNLVLINGAILVGVATRAEAISISSPLAQGNAMSASEDLGGVSQHRAEVVEAWAGKSLAPVVEGPGTGIAGKAQQRWELKRELISA